MTLPRFLHFCFGASLLLAGCKKTPEIQVYLAPRETAEDTSADSAGTHGAERARPAIGYILPPNWKVGDKGEMSVANFTIESDKGQATMSITPLGNLGGHEAELVNMWREQVDEAPLAPSEAQKALSGVAIGSAAGQMFEVTGHREGKGIRLITAMTNRPDGTWFFKLAGDEAVVDDQKKAFLEFLRTFQFAGGGTETASAPEPAAPAPPPAEPPPVQPPPAEPPPVAPAPAATAAAAPSDWKMPEGWHVLEPGQMQVAKFAVPDQGNAKAEVSVSVFNSDTGGMLGNVNRWRGQLGLEPVDDAGLATIVKPVPGVGQGAIVADFDKDGRRLIGAIVPRDGHWWFYKLLGDAEAVAPAEKAFLEFVQTPPPAGANGV